MSVNTARSLGDFLRSRRSRLDPASFGYSGRRRTPGLRREEVAQRAHISPTWYTWLEQGRGGAPSAEVLDRISGALMLTDTEREHLFMLGLGRPPEVRYKSVEGVHPRLQRLLDSLEASPAIIKTAIWDVVAWNRAAAVVLTDYGTLPPGERNILQFLFRNPTVRAKQHDWESVARFVVGAFRADVARAGLASEVSELVDELCGASPEFEALWRDNDVLNHGDSNGIKRLLHPVLGQIELEYSAFSVDGRPDLGMIVYTPMDPAIAARVKVLAAAKA
ncbi:MULTISPECIES: helix-turn-helix transcriptional regulator [unclassified Caballeronia]|jgi:transcriptional regulator with XRE-family HTH domain|uniref:helix-turn-helix transcriptional regulator n=1 Tax=unclassified Caballeronia TaxID=2646786 RepID=UPI002029185E|nr:MULTISPECIES: helix-turn-helix transcriptional regulator [unclassified Caballeronia]MDR5774505.1 helix-turn-helix transcriptional regulator [Caballeronia sp. LZ002]MDR5849941.1 helix-turn-helix transcriptional regulator [Caballeronia sp. LZ003]